MNLFSVFLLGLAVLASSARAAVPDWPQWRGPQRDGQFTGPEWPDKLDANHLQRLWRIDLGPSYSGPIVSGDRVFSTESKDKKIEVIRAFDRTTGKELWSHSWEGAMTVPFFAKSNGDWIRSTPALDGDRLYVAGMRDVLVCLDASTGAEQWRKDFVKELGTALPDFGFVCSPLVDDEAVYVQAGGSIAKLDKLTGRILWRSMREKGGMMGSAFSSPIFAELAGKRPLVMQTREKLAGLDPADGTILWEQAVEAFRGMNILTPVVHKDTLFTSTYGGKTIGFHVVQADGKFTVTETWRNKSQGYMSTPVVIEGVAYHHLKSQRLMAINVATGHENWTTDLSFGKYMSFVARGDRILALDQRGVLLLIRASKEKFDLLDKRNLADAETWAHLAVAGDQVFVRELNGLAAYRWHRSGK